MSHSSRVHAALACIIQKRKRGPFRANFPEREASRRSIDRARGARKCSQCPEQLDCPRDRDFNPELIRADGANANAAGRRCLENGASDLRSKEKRNGAWHVAANASGRGSRAIYEDYAHNCNGGKEAEGRENLNRRSRSAGREETAREETGASPARGPRYFRLNNSEVISSGLG